MRQDRHQFFIMRSKSDTNVCFLYLRPAFKSCGLRYDQTSVLKG